MEEGSTCRVLHISSDLQVPDEMKQTRRMCQQLHDPPPSLSPPLHALDCTDAFK